MNKQLGPNNSRTNDRLFEDLYAELKSIAKSHMRGQGPQHTLQPTALINEVYLRLQSSKEDYVWENQQQFLRVAATVMRRILIDHARSKNCDKRGGPVKPVELTGLESNEVTINGDLLEIHEALLKLEKLNPEKAELVTMRFFAGFTIDEAANALSISRTTAKQWWQFCKAWLQHELSHH